MIELIPDFDVRIPENRAALRRFLVACWRETYPAQLGETVAAVMIARLESEDLDGLLADPQTKVMVVTKAGEILGSCMHQRVEGGAIWFSGLYVTAAEQRRGHGRRMLEALQKLNPPPVRLCATVLLASEPALRFYEAFGFRDSGEVEYELAPGHVEPAFWIFLDLGGWRVVEWL